MGYVAWKGKSGSNSQNIPVQFITSIVSKTIKSTFKGRFIQKSYKLVLLPLDISPPRKNKWNKGSRSLVLPYNPPPPKKKNNNNKSVEALPGKGTSHSQWKSFLVPSVSSSSTRFPLQAARKAVLSKGSGGLKFRINKRIRTSWFSWFNVSKLGWRKWWGNWKNDHRIGEGFYVYTLVSYTCSTGVLYQALSQHETSKGHLRLEMLMSETAW